MRLPGFLKGPRSSWVADCLILFLLATALIWPLYKVKYLNNWGSIDSTFIADARMLKESYPRPGWQPYWYCGTRWDYIYPPALRYGTAILSTVFPIIPARAYHMYTALLYCLGIVGVYLLARIGSGARRWAWLAAAAVATLSPIFLFVPEVRNDAGALFHSPQRLNVLVRWGEGPHISALSMLGVALALSCSALRRWRPALLALSGVAAALVVSNNFYGATALALFFSVLTWSVWLARVDRRVWLRAAGIAAIAGGLTAFWLTPSYLRITTENLKYVAQPGKSWSYAVGLAFLALFAFVTWKWFRNRVDIEYPLFVAGGLAFIALYVLGERYLGFRVFGEPARLMPEFDLFFLLAAVELLRGLWRRVSSVIVHFAIAVFVAGYFLGAGEYLTHAWKIYARDGAWKGRIEYRISEWMHANLPEARALATGSVRFWYNAWFDGAQFDGGSLQGLLNQTLALAQWELAAGDNAELSILWLQATGVDVAIAHDKSSREIYHDFTNQHKFDSLPVVWDSGEGDRIHRIPRRFPGIARVVETAKAAALRPVTPAHQLQDLRAYVDLVERGPDSPATSRLEGMSSLRVRARVAEGQSVLVMESYDPYWHASSSGRPLPIRKDVLGFMLIDAPPGDHDLRLVFETPLENWVGRVLTALTSLVCLRLLWRGKRRYVA
jgi:hypothetical protein